jgi:hypothetical protein
MTSILRLANRVNPGTPPARTDGATPAARGRPAAVIRSIRT